MWGLFREDSAPNHASDTAKTALRIGAVERANPARQSIPVLIIADSDGTSVVPVMVAMRRFCGRMVGR